MFVLRQFDLRGNGVLEVVKEVKHAFPPEYMSGTASQVFGFLADCIKEANPTITYHLDLPFLSLRNRPALTIRSW